MSWCDAVSADSPGPGGGAADAGVAREVGAVEQLRRTQGRSAQEAFEVPQARDLQELPEVPFQVGRDVRPQEAFRVDIAILVQLREAAAHQELLGGQIAMRRLGLGERERFELDDGGTARQRIGYRLHQAERLRSGQQEGAMTPALTIDRHLQMAEEAGRVLHLVED